MADIDKPEFETASEWSRSERVAEYLSREIPHRLTAEEMLLEALPARVERFLDLGAGDGRRPRLLRADAGSRRGAVRRRPAGRASRPRSWPAAGGVRSARRCRLRPGDPSPGGRAQA